VKRVKRRIRLPGTRTDRGAGRRTARALGSAAVAALALAGCSSGADSPGAGAAAATGSPPASASASKTARASAPPSAVGSPAPSAGLESASADEILAAARTALLRASSVHAKGDLVSDGTPYTIDMRMVRGTGAAGRMSVQGKGLNLVRIGDTAYVQPDAAFLRSATNSASSVRLLSGTYFKVTARKSAVFAPFVALTDAEQAFGSTLAPAGAVTKGKVTRLNKARVLDLLVDGGRSGHVFVALAGPPYPLRIVYGSSARQHVDLDRYGARVKLAAPPASKVRSVPGF
jgi:hypothetical protein